jgi:non-lysosomal glucosylceramidase
MSITNDLHKPGKQRVFPGTATEAAFLLGGIGTGNVSVGARGELRDWEIFNVPGKGVSLHYSFFAIRVQEEGQPPICKVLESKLNPPFSKSHGFHSGTTAGLPRFEESELKGEYPFAEISLKDRRMPVEVTLEAFTPMIPLNTDDSSIPCAVLRYRVKNKTDKKAELSIAASMLNPVGFTGYDRFENLTRSFPEGNINEFRRGKGFSGLFLTNTKLSEKDLKYGNLSVVTTAPKVTYKTHWMHKDWWDGIHDMWDDFTEDGRLEDNPVVYEENNRLAKIGSMAVSDTLEGGESKDFLFLLTWYFPNRMEGWSQECCGPRCECKITQNYYANLFKSSWHVAEYMIENFDRLYKATSDFHKALFESSLPPFVVDAIASNMTVLRSTTCFRLKNGKFFGYEGCFDQSGCCEGNCTHVWNYAQTLAFLYPDLEKDMRRTEFNVETEEDGKMAFRTMKLFGSAHRYHPAADGQLGCIIRLYRDWKFSGDRKLLESVWDNAKKALDFAFTYWDKDGDFVLDSQQHNTYDIEFYGPNSLTNSMFYGALKAGAKMAEAMGDFESKQKFEKALQEGSKKMDALLWNGEYYIQVIDDVNRYKYQYGKGCLSDQLLGQLNSHIVGLGYILPEEHVKKAVHSIYKYNFFKDLSDHHNVQRTYALNDEQGLVLCTWPKGGRPKFPFVYCDEVWTGFEYQVAAHLIFEGFINEGLEIVKAVRDRHDGFKRNPWNEVECGHHYFRSMSSWGLLIALCGYKFDLVEGVIEFNPVINKEDFRCFFSCGKAWGIFEQKRNPQTGKPEYNVKTLYGNLEGITVKAGGEVIEI